LSELVAYLPGGYPEHAGPLGRFLPPIPEGAGAAWLRQRLPAGAWVLEPFGASPRLAVEAARAGYRVLAAVNNPIARFLLELHADPPSESELRTALADLAVTQKAGERLEPLLRGLYRSECTECRQPVEVQAFIWERQANAPSGVIYHCSNCNENYERPASAHDVAQAGRFASSGLHRARALERVTPLDDPDRAYAEEALTMYLPRAMYALVNLVNKLESFPPARRRSLAALLLAVFDQTNDLWPHPPARLRPRQLTTPPRFLEKNVWLAMEEAIESWALSLGSAPPLPLTLWPELPPESGGIVIYEGRLKELVDQARQANGEMVTVQAALTALPRPNQAYWTLSALWAGWLWGHAANASFKSVLHRRRYDWEWHTEALYSAMRNLAILLPPSTPALGLIGEIEPGFLSAALLSAELAGFDLQDVAMRAEEGQAQVMWQRGDTDPAARRPPPGTRTQNLPAAIQAAAQDYLRQTGEPASHLYLHAAALRALAQSHRLLSTTEKPEATAAERFKQLGAALEEAFVQPNAFSRYGGSSRSLETGLWWLAEGTVAGGASPAAETAIPLTDRVEMEIVRYLQKNPESTLEQVDKTMCAQFTGLLTPRRELIQECLASYGEAQPGGGRGWQLRAEDAPARRRADLEAMNGLLDKTGTRLGYRVEVGETKAGRAFLKWIDSDGQAAGIFFVIASAMLGSIVFGQRGEDLPARRLIILPGGRARLVEYKLSHDPRLRSALEDGWRLIKFRHLRRLADDLSLRQENLDRLLDLDPLANRDPQLPLL
jgi:hypothetical protein